RGQRLRHPFGPRGRGLDGRGALGALRARGARAGRPHLSLRIAPGRYLHASPRGGAGSPLKQSPTAMTNPFEPILTELPGLTLESFRDRVWAFNGRRLLVLGDLMLDEYVWGEVSRVSPEAPVPVVEARRHTYGLGGAGNVVNNVRALGGEVIVAGIVGQDA